MRKAKIRDILLRRTQLMISPRPAAKVNAWQLCKVIECWERLADALEKRLGLLPDESIVWRLTYDWPPDDDLDAECIPRYLPFASATVAIVDRQGRKVASYSREIYICHPALDDDGQSNAMHFHIGQASDPNWTYNTEAATRIIRALRCSLGRKRDIKK